jgi:UDP-2-acetamido-3-amino-2,3-dideoxy-glucuronate N-acetyltransferase
VCGITVGRCAFVGAGGVVTHDVPDYCLVYGNPAELKGWMCACGVKLEIGYSEAVDCRACGANYVWDGKCLKEASRKDAPVET